MLERDLKRLCRARDAARDTGRFLDNKPFQHGTISLPALEAQRFASKLESWLSEIIYIVESELADLIKE